MVTYSRGSNTAIEVEDRLGSTGGGNYAPAPVQDTARQDLGWLSPTNTEKALSANPSTRTDLQNMLTTSGDKRTPAQWLYDDLLAGDTNTFFSDITKQASGLFSGLDTPAPSNPVVSVPDFFAPTPEPPADSSGGGGFIDDTLALVLGLLGAKPEPGFVNAPVTTTETHITTNVDNSVAYNDSRSWVDNSSTSITYGATVGELESLFMRIADFASVPRGGNNVISPSAPTSGYAPNPDQSVQRLGGQTIASVGGLELNTGGVGVGGMGFSWKSILLTIGASLFAMWIFKRFVK